jgi:hypothetical protein
MSEESFDRILRQTLDRVDEHGPCPDPADLAAFHEGALSRAERAAIERHASNCARCAAQLAVLVRLADVDGRGRAPRRGLRTWGWRWLIPLATAVVVFAVWSDIGERPATPVNERFEATAEQQSKAPPSADAREIDALRAPSADAVEQDPADEQMRQRAALDKSPPKATVERVPVSPPVLLERKATEGVVGGNAPPPPAEAPAETPPGAKVEELEYRVAQDAAQAPGRTETIGETGNRPGTDTSLAKDQAASARADTSRNKAGALSAAKHRAPLVVRAGDAVLVRAADDRIERSTDGGLTWRSEYAGRTAGLLVGICPSTEICWVGGEAGRILLRDTSGLWAERSIPAGVAVVAIEAEDARHATVTGRDGRRFLTTDGGRSWTP